MDEDKGNLLTKILCNPATTQVFLAIILTVLGLLLAMVIPSTITSWYHVFCKLMMFMFFAMSFFLSVVALIKGSLILIQSDSKYDKKLTTLGLLISLLIILTIVISLYSNPYLIDIFGLTKKKPMLSPNIIQQW
jgi:hypothetical protein